MDPEPKSRWTAGFRFMPNEVSMVGFLAFALSLGVLGYRWPGHALRDFALSTLIANLVFLLMPPRLSARKILRRLSASAGTVLIFAAYLHFVRS